MIAPHPFSNFVCYISRTFVIVTAKVKLARAKPKLTKSWVNEKKHLTKFHKLEYCPSVRSRDSSVRRREKTERLLALEANTEGSLDGSINCVIAGHDLVRLRRVCHAGTCDNETLILLFGSEVSQFERLSATKSSRVPPA